MCKWLRTNTKVASSLISAWCICFLLCNQYCSSFQLGISSSEDVIFLFQYTLTSSSILCSQIFWAPWLGSDSRLHWEAGPLMQAAVETWELLAGRSSSKLLDSKQGSSVKLRILENFKLPWQSYGSEILLFSFESRAAAQGFKVLCSQIFEQSTSATAESVASPESFHQRHRWDLASSSEMSAQTSLYSMSCHFLITSVFIQKFLSTVRSVVQWYLMEKVPEYVLI